MHKGKNQYLGREIANINYGQGGWVHVTPVANDIFIAGKGDEVFPIDAVADAGGGTDTWFSSKDHGIETGEELTITGTVNYGTTASPNLTTVTDVEKDRFKTADNYTAESFGAKATATITVNDYSLVYNQGSNPNRGYIKFTDSLGRITTITAHKESFLTSQGEFSGPSSNMLTATLIKNAIEAVGVGITASVVSNVVTVTQDLVGPEGNTFISTNLDGAEIDEYFSGGLNTKGQATYLPNPIFYYPEYDYFLGIKNYPTVDNDQSTGSCPLLRLELTPLVDSGIEISKADTGSVVDVYLQAGQAIFGAFTKIKIKSAVGCSAAIYRN